MMMDHHLCLHASQHAHVCTCPAENDHTWVQFLTGAA